MKTGTVLTEFEARAADALRALLGRFSAIELIELKHESQPGSGSAILARIRICGHSHTLACELNSSGELSQLRGAFREQQTSTAPFAEETIPVVIAPHLSPEAQALCKQNKTGFLDFEGNARLTAGDFFIVMRSLPRAAATRVSAASQKRSACTAVDPIFSNALPEIPHKHVEPVGSVAVPAAG
jgi:hypothetical protein